MERWTSDPNVNGMNPEIDMFWRNVYMAVYGALGIFQGFALLITSLIFAIGCLRAARDLHNKLLHNCVRLPMAFFDTTPLGRILNRFSKDVDTVDNVLPMVMVSFLHFLRCFKSLKNKLNLCDF